MRSHALLLTGLAFLVLSCSESPVGPGSERNDPVELTSLEAIPYEALGQGTLAFERVSREEAASGIYIVDVDGRTSYGFGGIALQQPSLSPDGRQFVFTQITPKEFEFDVYLADRHGDNVQLLTAHEGRKLSPVWFAGGSQIAFIEATEGSRHVYRQSPSPEATDRVLVKTFSDGCAEVGFDFGADAISVSPEGIAVFSNVLCHGIQEIATLDLNDGAFARVLTDTVRADNEDAIFKSPAWSPDGLFIAFMEHVRSVETLETIRTNIKRMNADGSGIVALASIEGGGIGGERSCCTGGHSVVWSPDGSKIAFIHEEGDLVAHIYVVGRDAEGLRQITSKADADDRNLSWVP